MQPTEYTDVNTLINDLLINLKTILNEKLVGLYLHGSLLLGDFDPKLSDIDLVTVLSTEVNDLEFDQLKELHSELARKYPTWDNRIEVCYPTLKVLKSIKISTDELLNISPGEPFHRIQSRKEWLMNWYLVRENAKTIFGPNPKTIIQPISHDEYLQSVRDHARSWDKWVENMHNQYALSYTVLTLCRALYSIAKGDQVSKKQAAKWAIEQYPDWSDLIKKALEWRDFGKDDSHINTDSVYPEVVEFVKFANHEIIGN